MWYGRIWYGQTWYNMSIISNLDLPTIEKYKQQGVSIHSIDEYSMDIHGMDEDGMDKHGMICQLSQISIFRQYKTIHCRDVKYKVCLTN